MPQKNMPHTVHAELRQKYFRTKRFSSTGNRHFSPNFSLGVSGQNTSSYKCVTVLLTEVSVYFRL